MLGWLTVQSKNGNLRFTQRDVGGDGDSFGKNFSVASKVEETQANKLVVMVTKV